MTQLAFEIADSGARSDIETLCRMTHRGSHDPQNATEFRACWFDTKSVLVHAEPVVRDAVEYLELRGMLRHDTKNPHWIRVIEKDIAA